MDSTNLDSKAIESVASHFSALGDPIRLRILDLLTSGQMCVCELLESIDVAPNLLSYHLRVLRDAGLVNPSRRGRWVDYTLSRDALHRLRSVIPAT